MSEKVANQTDPVASEASPSHSASSEHDFHHYTGSHIPWFVRGIWILFWIFAIAYTIRFVFPHIQTELFGMNGPLGMTELLG